MAQEAPRYAGPTDKGFLLPNGWTLKPAGEHVPLADLPLNIIPLADSGTRWPPPAVTTPTSCRSSTCKRRKVVDHQTVRQSWFGLALAPEADRIWWSGGGGNMLHAFRLADRRLIAHDRPRTRDEGQRSAQEPSHFRSGLALDAASQSCSTRSTSTRGTISALDLDRSKGAEVRAGRHAAL